MKTQMIGQNGEHYRRRVNPPFILFLGVYKTKVGNNGVSFSAKTGGILFIGWEWDDSYVYSLHVVTGNANSTTTIHEISSYGDWGSFAISGNTITYNTLGDGKAMTLIYIYL